MRIFNPSSLIRSDIYNVASTQDGKGDVILTPAEIEARSNAVQVIY